MWIYWKQDPHLTAAVKNKYKTVDKRIEQHINLVAYDTKRNIIYSVVERNCKDIPTVTTLKEIDEIRLMYSLGLTEKDM